MSTLKTTPTTVDPLEFLETVADEAKRRDSLYLLQLIAAETGQPPRMWGPSIVGFGSFPYRRADGSEYEWLAIGFSPRQSALTLYVMPGVKKFPELLADLGHPKTGKSCVYLRSVQDLDETALRTLVREAYRDITSGAAPDYS